MPDMTRLRPSGRTRRRVRLGAVVAALACAVSAVGLTSVSTAPTAAAADPTLGSGGEYHPLTPKRIYDTRNGINDTAPLGKKPANRSGASFNVALLGKGGIPASRSDVLAVVLNVTVTEPGAAGYLSIRPAGSSNAESSLVNFEAGRTVPNMAIVGVGSNGAATATLVTPGGNSSAHVLIDVFGWISTSGFVDARDTGSRIVPTSPSRILDTRSTPTPAGWAAGRAIGQQEQLALQVRGARGVPNDPSISGVVINVTGIDLGGGTYLAAMPTRMSGGEAPTSVTNLNHLQVKANTAIVPIGPDGKIHIFNRMGSTHVIVDVLGYLQQGHSASSTTGRVIPLEAPFRAFDTRQEAFAKVPLGTNATEDWSFKAFTGSVSLNGTSIGAQSGLIGNLTATGLTRTVPSRPADSYLTAFPGGTSRPNSSHLNLREGESVPNMALLKYGSANGDPNTLRIYNYDGAVHYILDVYAVILA